MSSQPQFGWPISSKITEEVKKLDVWTVFSPASGNVPKDAIAMSQGFMSFPPPPYVLNAAKAAMDTVAANHYIVPRGLLRLRQAIAKHYSPSFKLPGGRDLNVDTEILVTAGANEGMYSFAAAFLEEGDEVILFEPYFDQYTSQITFNGGVPVYVPMRAAAAAATSNISSSEWTIDIDELKAAITPKTKMIWINSPHNPVGKVFSEAELRAIGNVAEENDLLILSDEVYDCMTFDDLKHIRIASLDNFWRRTMTVGSAGKSFAATGYRVGYLMGPENLIRPALAVSTRIVFCANSVAQSAIAVGLEDAGKYQFFETQNAEYEERRNVLMEGLDAVGLPYTVPEGAYFLLVNTATLEIPKDYAFPALLDGRARDWYVSWFIAHYAGVITIPPTDFYSKPHWPLGENFIRIAFCKDLQTLRDACERLLKLKPFIKAPLTIAA